MVTMNEVIKDLDELKPNAYGEEAKFKWMSKLDGMISREVMHIDPPEYEYPKCMDSPLLVEAPYDDIYVLYCASMVDFHNREYNNYNNSALMFNERLEAFKVHYIRNHHRCEARNFRNIMG